MYLVDTLGYISGTPPDADLSESSVQQDLYSICQHKSHPGARFLPIRASVCFTVVQTSVSVISRRRRLFP